MYSGVIYECVLGQKWHYCPQNMAICCCAWVNVMWVLFMNPAVPLCPICQKIQVMYFLWHNFNILNTQCPPDCPCSFMYMAVGACHCSGTLCLYRLWCILIDKVQCLLSDGHMSVRLPSVDDRVNYQYTEGMNFEDVWTLCFNWTRWLAASCEQQCSNVLWHFAIPDGSYHHNSFLDFPILWNFPHLQIL
jgi:hypothetical protein